MNEINKKIVELINENYTLNEIEEKLNLSRKQLYHRLVLLKNMGYLFKKNYYSNGEIILSNPALTGFDNWQFNNTVNIITANDENNLRLLAISDLHLCSIKDDINALDKIYEYAIKNDIHNIINCGDLIDGTRSNFCEPKEIEKQIDYLIKKYPFDKNILNYTVLGNHDIMPLKYIGLDLKQILENKRLDIIPISYCQSIINIKNSRLLLYHHVNQIKPGLIGADLVLSGHSHFSKFTLSPTNDNIIKIPSLSNIEMNNRENYLYLPQAIDLTLHFNNDKIVQIIIYQLLFINNKFYTINEINYQIKSKLNLKNNLTLEQLPESKIILPNKNELPLESEQIKIRELSKI